MSVPAPALPVPVPDTPCPSGTTVEQCAAQASWASAEAADATARWIELTLYAEIFGGLAAIVAAGFAGAAFVMSRRGAIASEKQAHAAEHQLDHARETRDADRDARALEHRPRLRFAEHPIVELSSENEFAVVEYVLTVDGKGAVLDLGTSLQLEWVSPKRDNYKEDWTSPDAGVSILPQEKLPFILNAPVNIEAWKGVAARAVRARLHFRFFWRDESDYEVEELWEVSGLLGEHSRRFERPRLINRHAEYNPD